jgi:hypothetical protein
MIQKNRVIPKALFSYYYKWPQRHPAEFIPKKKTIYDDYHAKEITF